MATFVLMQVWLWQVHLWITLKFLQVGLLKWRHYSSELCTLNLHFRQIWEKYNIYIYLYMCVYVIVTLIFDIWCLFCSPYKTCKRTIVLIKHILFKVESGIVQMQLRSHEGGTGNEAYVAQPKKQISERLFYYNLYHKGLLMKCENRNL